MVWQDIAIGIANIVMMSAIMPQILHGFTEKRSFILLKTSIPTSIGLGTMAICFFSLKLYFSAIVGTISMLMWLVLLLQRLIYPKA